MAQKKAAVQGGLVPRLRFPEFRDAGGWVSDLLGEREFSKFINERTSLEQLSLDSYVSTENFLPGYSGVTLASKLPSSGSFTHYKKGDILISNIRPYLKKIWLADKEGACSNDVVVIRSGEKVNRFFLCFLIKNDKFINYIMAGAKGVKMPRGDISLMKEYPVMYPSKNEQQKIADCLSALDDLITAEAKKLNALKAHKKGLMQELFPREGETVPRLRFPEFRDGGEWAEIPMKDIAHVIMGASPSSKAYNAEAVGLPFMQGNADIKNGLSAPRLFTSQVTKECKVGDILLSIRAPVGTVAISRHHACIGRGLSAIRALPSNSQEYLHQWLLSFEPRWQGLSQGGTFDAVNSDDIKDLKVYSPHDTKEQQKIAGCLSSLDDLITGQARKVEAIKTHKKGLMQQLFPVADTMAG